jgi:hypothetical protein
LYKLESSINNSRGFPHSSVLFIDVHVMNLPQTKPIVPSPETPGPQPDPEKAIESWEGEGGKVAPAEDARAGSAEPGTRRT